MREGMVSTVQGFVTSCFGMASAFAGSVFVSVTACVIAPSTAFATVLLASAVAFVKPREKSDSESPLAVDSTNEASRRKRRCTTS